MTELDFLRLAKVGAIELELQALEGGSVPAPASVAELSAMELGRRVGFLVEIGRGALLKHLSTSERD